MLIEVYSNGYEYWVYSDFVKIASYNENIENKANA